MYINVDKARDAGLVVVHDKNSEGEFIRIDWEHHSHENFKKLVELLSKFDGLEAMPGAERENFAGEIADLINERSIYETLKRL